MVDCGGTRKSESLLSVRSSEIARFGTGDSCQLGQPVSVKCTHESGMEWMMNKQPRLRLTLVPRRHDAANPPTLEGRALGFYIASATKLSTFRGILPQRNRKDCKTDYRLFTGHLSQ